MELYGRNTGEPIPEIYYTSNRAWDAYMGNLWAGLLSSNFSHGTVIEIAPGASAKIGHALASLNFHGTIYLVDAASKILEETRKSYQEILPHARIIVFDQLLADCLTQLPVNADALLSNHPLDDMILARGASPEDFDRLFRWAESDAVVDSPAIAETWKKICSDPSLLTQTTDAVYGDWVHMIEALNPKSCIISQYGSSALTKQGMNDLNLQAKDLLDRLKDHFAMNLESFTATQATLNKNKNYGNAYIGLEVLNAAHWFVYNHTS